MLTPLLMVMCETLPNKAGPGLKAMEPSGAKLVLTNPGCLPQCATVMKKAVWPGLANSVALWPGKIGCNAERCGFSCGPGA